MFAEGAILIIDDDLDYSCLLQIALLEARVKHPVEIFNDGNTAVSSLQQGGALSGGGVPVLVLLDLRMPRMSGLDVLRWMRGEPHLAEVPIVVFTGIEAGEEPFQAMQLGATSVHVKPFSYRDLVREAQSLRDSYLAHAPGQLKHAA